MRAFLGLGSNLGDRQAYLREAVGSLSEVVAVSPVYETDPVGGPDGQGPYLNVVVEIDSDLTPRELLGVCHRLESAAGRVRQERWGPRTLDVDILWTDGDADRRARPPDPAPPHVRAALRDGAAAPTSPPTSCRPTGPSGPGVGSARWGRCSGRRSGPAGRDRPRDRSGSRRVARWRPRCDEVGWQVLDLIGRDASPDATRDAARDVDVVIVATPDAAVADVAAAIEPVEIDGGAAPGRIARPRRARAPPAAGGPASAGGDARSDGRRGAAAGRGVVRRRRRPDGAADRGRPRRPRLRGGRRRPCPLPRRRGDRLEPRRRPARSGRAGRGRRRACRSRPISTSCGRRSTTWPRSVPPPRSPARPPAATTRRSSATSTPSTRASARPTRRWPTRPAARWLPPAGVAGDRRGCSRGWS